MKALLLRCVLFFIIFNCFTSCVSSKKYAALKISSDQLSKEQKEQIKSTAAYADSLKLVLFKKDSLIDSLSIKIADLQTKKEKTKTIAAKKASSLSRDQEYDKKSQFVYNFAAYIEWPVIYNGTDFIIGVAGDQEVIKKIENKIGDKKVGGKKLKIEEYDKVGKYNVVYVTSSNTNSFSAIKSDVKKNKTILISDDESLYFSGAHISFVLDDDKVRYTINKPSIEKIGLKVSQELMRFSE